MEKNIDIKSMLLSLLNKHTVIKKFDGFLIFGIVLKVDDSNLIIVDAKGRRYFLNHSEILSINSMSPRQKERFQSIMMGGGVQK